jgi:putative ABC transport system permease protein
VNGPLREQWERIRGFIRGTRADRDLDNEIAAHIDLAVDDHVRRGMSPEEARRLAATKFGSQLSAREQASDQRGLPGLESFVTDLRYAVRMMRKNPGFTAMAVTMLALGIGINAMVFTVTNTVLFKGFPLVERNDRIVYMTTGPGCCVSYPNFADWRAQATSFEGMALVHGVQQTYSDQGGFPETYYTTEVSADTFRLVGQRPILGRDFTPSDEVPGAPPVAILRYAFWERRYGMDPAIVGQTVRINGVPTTVIGVMPKGFSFPQNQDLWLPLVTTPEVLKRENTNTWFAFGRMAEGVTIESARAEMETIGKRLEAAYPAVNKGRPPIVYAFHEFFIGPTATLIYKSMWGAVGFVLLIACANLANLLLARAMGRSREISVRIALGAGRWRIIRQLLIESVMLSALGGLAGFGIAKWGLRIFALEATGAGVSDQIRGDWFDDILDYAMDDRVFAYLLAISIGTGLLFGLAPASRLSRLDVNATLKDGGRGTGGGARGKHLSALLVVAEMALAVVLLAGAGLMIRSFLKIYTADLGFRAEHIVATLFDLPKTGYASPEAQIAFYDRLKMRVEGIPGVESTAIGSLPAGGSVRIPYELAGAPPVDEQRRPTLWASTIGPGYFRTLGAPLLSGREFHDVDGVSGLPVVVVNQQFADSFWPGEDPLGKRLRLFQRTTPGAWLTVVGVVSTIAQNDPLRPALNALIYLPYQQGGRSSLWVLARTRVPLDSVAAALRGELHSLDPALPIQLGPFALNERLAQRYQYRAISGVLFLMCAAVALLLASIGLYAVVAHSVSQRTQEIGIRMAIGGTARDILSLVFTQGMVPLGLGLTLGLAAAFAFMPTMKAVLVQVSPADPLTFAVASVVLIVAAVLGCVIPARRAMSVDPLVALRSE